MSVKSKQKFSFILTTAVMLMFCLQQPGIAAQAGSKDHMPVSGWIDGNCLAIAHKKLAKQTGIFVVTLDGPQTITSARIIGPATTGKCRPLVADRREINQSGGLTFYEIKPATVFGLAIGIIGNVTDAQVKDGVVMADIGGDGKIEQFSLCATSEGLSFDIWHSKPFKQKPIWSGYYYLGYDVERTCP